MTVWPILWLFFEYAYPLADTSYEPPLKIEPIYINEEPSNRYTCEFTKIKEQEKERAEETLKELMKKRSYQILLLNNLFDKLHDIRTFVTNK